MKNRLATTSRTSSGSLVPSAADRAKLTFEITPMGKAALAWEDRERPRLSSTQAHRGTGGPLVTAAFGADVEPDPPVLHEDGVSVCISQWDPESADIFVSIGWTHDFSSERVDGPMTVAQLAQLVELLTVASEEGKRVGLFRAKVSVAQPPAGPETEHEDNDDLAF